MLRLLPIFGILLILLAGGILVLSVEAWLRADPQLEMVLNCPSAVDRLRQDVDAGQSFDRRVSPLVVQAEALAAYLNPPQRADKPSGPVATASTSRPVSPIRPAAPSVKFRLVGTSYYAGEPGRSMALIGELGSAGEERWVKEGAQVGHFVIQEIRHGVIVYRDGEKLREMAVERGTSMPSLVRDLRPGERRVGAAREDGGLSPSGFRRICGRRDYRPYRRIPW